MREAIFIRLENSLEKAMTYRNSPVMRLFNFEGVQLISDPNGFVQRSNALEGIEIESFVAYVYNSCGDLLAELNNNTIEIVRNFNDRVTGLPQVEWKINTVAYDFEGQLISYDFGGQLIYLDILQGENYHIYSSPFYWTDDDAEYTSRWDYRNKFDDTMLSTQLKTFFIQPADTETKEVYTTVGSNRNVEVGGSHLEAELWRFGISDIYAFRTFMRMRMYNLVYLNYYKCVANEAIEYPRLIGIENFSNVDFIVSVDYENIFDPNYVAPVPPPIPPVSRFIFIDGITIRFKPTVVTINFHFEGENYDPEWVSFQYSPDGGQTWVTMESGNYDGSIEIREDRPYINFPVPEVYGYLFRIIDSITNTISDTAQIPTPIITITDVIRTGAGTTFLVYYNSNFIQQDGVYEIQYSMDGITWQSSAVLQRYESEPGSGFANVVTSYVPNFFRINYSYFYIFSNTYNFS